MSDVQYPEDRDSKLMKTFGVQYFEPEVKTIVKNKGNELYTYDAYIGEHKIDVEQGDCLFTIEKNIAKAGIVSGFYKGYESKHFAVKIRGYSPPNADVSLRGVTNLPYVNGCSTKQLFPPIRTGDPTFQYLRIPPYASEQAHHIHSTVRVVYILDGHGYSIVGMDKANVTEELYAGKTIVLDPMCPHHFETDSEHLICLPVHIFSSSGAGEYNHPMFNGTFMMNQGQDPNV